MYAETRWSSHPSFHFTVSGPCTPARADNPSYSNLTASSSCPAVDQGQKFVPQRPSWLLWTRNSPAVLTCLCSLDLETRGRRRPLTARLLIDQSTQENLGIEPAIFLLWSQVHWWLLLFFTLWSFWQICSSGGKELNLVIRSVYNQSITKSESGNLQTTNYTSVSDVRAAVSDSDYLRANVVSSFIRLPQQLNS